MKNNHLSRRTMLVTSAATLAGGALALRGTNEARAEDSTAAPAPPPTKTPSESWPAKSDDGNTLPPSEGGRDYLPVVTPNGSTLPFKVVGGVKVYHLVAEEVTHEFAPGLSAECWGYNGSTPGPTIEAVEGDRVRFYVTNHLPAPTTVHWHGVRVPNGMDGVNGLTQKAIPPGETYRYEFTLQEAGTFMYHPHFDEMTQQAMGMMGMFIIHPRKPKGPKIDRDFAVMLSEWRIDPGTKRPNPLEMIEFNVLTMNSRVFPATEPLVVKRGERVRIRFGNLGAMDHHPIHLHGFQFKISQTDGGEVPEVAQAPANTVLVPVGSTRAFEFLADEPGDWVMHCHMTHHTMNQMGHKFPNMVGVESGTLDQKVQSLLPAYMTMGETGMGDMADMRMPMPTNSIPMMGGEGPFGTIDMGGMFTVVKIRDGLTSYKDPGWYRHPAGTVAVQASASEIQRDGVDVTKKSPRKMPTSMPAGADPTTKGTLYTCPMHPKVVTEKPGNCPICGMKLVPKK